MSDLQFTPIYTNPRWLSILARKTFWPQLACFSPFCPQISLQILNLKSVIKQQILMYKTSQFMYIYKSHTRIVEYIKQQKSNNNLIVLFVHH